MVASLFEMTKTFHEMGGIMKQNKVISRRSFLKGSAGLVGAGALAMGVGVGSLIRPSTAHASLDLTVGYLDPDEVRRLAWYHYFNSGG